MPQDLAFLKASPLRLSCLLCSSHASHHFQPWTLACSTKRFYIYSHLLQVRKKNGKPELVLLDHGLYRQITDEFRIEYAGELSRSLQGMLRVCHSGWHSPMYMGGGYTSVVFTAASMPLSTGTSV